MTDIGSNLDEPAEAPAPRVQRAKAAPATEAVGMPKRVKIRLEDSDEIPPNGLFLGHNGVGYLLRAGEDVEVPEFLLEILDHAVTIGAITDPTTKQVIGYRERLRYNYRRV